MSEPPKPITRLAEPVERARPWRRNGLGDAALVLAAGTLVLPGAALTFSWFGPSIAIGLSVCVFLLCWVGSVVTTIYALAAARRRRLERSTAIMALIVTSVELCAVVLILTTFCDPRAPLR